MTATLSRLSEAQQLNAPTLHQLDNGLTIIAEQVPVDAVNLSVWLNVGSAREAHAINGMAHFLEHMVFKGTPRLRSGEFEQLIEARGAVTNAATSQDYTYYYVTSAPQDFAELAPLQLDVVFNAAIPDDAFEQERLVVLEEIRRSQDSPQRRVFQQAMEVAFEQLPYRRPILGPAEVVGQLRPQQMRNFHQFHYSPEAMTVVAVGNLPAEELVRVVADSTAELMQDRPLPFSRNGNGNGHGSPENTEFETLWQAPATACEPAFSTQVRRETVDSTLRQARLVMMWRVPGLAQLEQTYALNVLAAVLGFGRMGRLIRDLREERGLVSSIAVRNMTQSLQGTFYISAQLPAENLEAVEAAIAHHIQRLHCELIAHADIERVRTQVANRFIFSNEAPSNRASLYGYYHAMLGDLQPALTYPSRLQDITTEDLQAAAQRYLSPDAYGITIQKPAQSAS